MGCCGCVWSLGLTLPSDVISGSSSWISRRCDVVGHRDSWTKPSNWGGTDAANGARLGWVCFVTCAAATVAVAQLDVWGQWLLYERPEQSIVGHWLCVLFLLRYAAVQTDDCVFFGWGVMMCVRMCVCECVSAEPADVVVVGLIRGR